MTTGEITFFTVCISTRISVISEIHSRSAMIDNTVECAWIIPFNLYEKEDVYDSIIS